LCVICRTGFSASHATSGNRAFFATRMKFIRGRQSCWAYVGLASALLAGLLLTPAWARAQCGHYVLVGAGAVNNSHGADGQILFGGKSSPVMPAPWHRPCSGPGCKEGPVAPPTAPVAPPPVVEKEWGHLARFALPGDQELRGFMPHSSCEHPFRRALTIYHPPRLSHC
jgi:hypothetical protein